MKAFSCRLKSIAVPETVREQFLIPARYSSIKTYQRVYQRSTGRMSAVMKEQALGKIEEERERRTYTLAELKAVFPHIDFSLPWVVEFGTGTGEFLIHVATQHPKKLFIGIDAAMPCIERALRRVSLQDSTRSNILFYNGLALDFLLADFKGFPLSEILVNFPDPWPKKRHIKRRLISAPFIEAVAQALAQAGVLITTTDVEPLWMYHLETIAACRTLQKVDLKNLPSRVYYDFYSRYREKNLAGTDRCYDTAHQIAQMS